MELTGVTSSSADAFISNCSSLVYWLSRNGGFCLGAPHKRGFALILSSLSLSLSLIPIQRPAHARVILRSTLDHPRSQLLASFESGSAGNEGASVPPPLSFSLSVPPSSSFPIFPLPPVSRGVCQRTLGCRSLRSVSLSYHYFLPALINCLFSVDFPCFMRPTSAINVTTPSPGVLHRSHHLPPPLIPHDHLSGIRDFPCQKHISPRPVINERPYPRASPPRSSFETLSLSLSLSVSEAPSDRRRNVWIGHYDIDVPAYAPSGVSCQPRVCVYLICIVL